MAPILGDVAILKTSFKIFLPLQLSPPQIFGPSAGPALWWVGGNFEPKLTGRFLPLQFLAVSPELESCQAVIHSWWRQLQL